MHGASGRASGANATLDDREQEYDRRAALPGELYGTGRAREAGSGLGVCGGFAAILEDCVSTGRLESGGSQARGCGSCCGKGTGAAEVRQRGFAALTMRAFYIKPDANRS